jgi:hypothetical protein
MASMSDTTVTTAHPRETDLSLRAAHDFVRPRVIWPPDPEDGSPIALSLWERKSVFEMAEARLVGGPRGGTLRLMLPDESRAAEPLGGRHIA